MRNPRNLDEVLDRALEQIGAQRLPEDEVDAIASHVWTRLAEADPAKASQLGEMGPIRSCEDYQALIPAFLDGMLSTSRRLLLESHTRECVPCRKALDSARRGEGQVIAGSPEGAERSPYLRWAAAAALVVALAGGSYWALALRTLQGQATVVEAGGEVYRMVGPGEGPLAAGEGVDYGERLRTGSGESAVLELADGSLVEVRGRSLLTVRANRRGTTVELERGSVIVQAAPRRHGHLYVATGDCLVAVKGTIFSVAHGTKGSRVSVVEGRVVVDSGGRETVLSPGDQATTHASLTMIPVAEDIAWSRDVDRYIELMREVTDLRRALTDEVPRPDLRYDSRLMGLVPETTSFYIALPNLAETIAEADRILRQRIADSRLLGEWWESRQGFERFGPSFDRVTDGLAELGGYLGDEVVVTAQLGADDDIGGPLVLAELRDAAGLRGFIERTMAEHGADGDGHEGMNGLVFIDDPTKAPAEDGDVYVWMSGDTLIASDRLASLQAALAAVSEGASGFASTRFGERLRDAYRDGAGVVIAADIERFAAAKLAAGDASGERELLEATGLLGAEHFLLEQRWVDGATQHRAVLGFDGSRRGMAAWLAEPAPMGSLDFVSPDAKFAAAVLLVDPSVMLDELLDLAVGTSGEAGVDVERSLDEMEAMLGFDIRHDAAVAFGGEVALAIDGPLLPEPSWKLILEVYDQTRAEFVLEQLAAFASRRRLAEGREPIELAREEVGGRAFWSLAGSPQPFHVTFEDGYLVAAPSRVLLDRAIRYRQSGYTLPSASRFRALLPVDGSANFSAIFYQDAMGLIEPLAERIASQDLTEQQRRAIASLAEESGPTLGYAYGEPDRVVFAASGTMSLLDAGLPGLLGLETTFDLEGFFHSIVSRDVDQITSES